MISVVHNPFRADVALLSLNPASNRTRDSSERRQSPSASDGSDFNLRPQLSETGCFGVDADDADQRGHPVVFDLDLEIDTAHEKKNRQAGRRTT